MNRAKWEIEHGFISQRILYPLRIFYLIIIIFYFLTNSCTKEIQLKNLDFKKSLVINSIFNTDSTFSFRISKITSIIDQYDTTYDSTRICLYENYSLILDTIILSNSLITNIFPKKFTVYSVTVYSKNYPILVAIDSIPDKIQIDKATIQPKVAMDKYGDYYAEAAITFTDPAFEHNYYELLIYHPNEKSDITYWFEFEELQITEPVLINEGDIDYKPSSYFFSDELFDGKKYTMHIKQQVNNNIISTHVTLRSVSKNYYMYRKYFTRHFHNQQMQKDFMDIITLGEPQPMYNSIVNGYGIFSGYTETSMTLEPLIYNNEK